VIPASHLAARSEKAIWRIIYRNDADAIIIVDVFKKKTAATPRATTEICQRRLWEYDHA
jgi:phage-related protein